jgi:hypothetical protein
MVLPLHADIRMDARATIVLVVLLMSLGCGPRGPILGGTTPANVGGTIAGVVKSAEGATALSARKVTAINADTGERFEVSTASNGGYTLRVPKGKYRLEVELRAGETLATDPGSTDINVGDLDARRDFEVTLTARR